jgi:hypothetical protein
MDERDLLLAWREIFHGKEASSETLAKAETLLEGLSGESPLYLRLANELEELRNGSMSASKKRPIRRRTK